MHLAYFTTGDIVLMHGYNSKQLLNFIRGK